MSVAPLEFRVMGPEWGQPLADLFSELVLSGADQYFHPHPLDAAHAMFRAAYSGRDLYFIAVNGRLVVGYGMLRGWDEGYAVPSLGIALHPQARQTGLARTFMMFLHSAARSHGAKQVRLKVHHNNNAARRLYQTLGYRFIDRDGDEVVGMVDLT